MAASFDIASVGKARATLLAVFGDQGFDTEPYSGASAAEIAAMIESRQLNMTLNQPDGNKVHIHFHHGKGPRAGAIYDIVDDLFLVDSRLSKDDDLVIVAADPPNDTVLRVLRSIWAKSGIYVNVIGIANLQYNVLRHALVPPHRRLDAHEADEVRQLYDIRDDSQMPGISRFDPVAPLIGLRPGEMCEIVRKSPTAMSATFYRICSP